MRAEDARMIIHSCQGGPTGLAKTDLYSGGYSIEKKLQQKWAENLWEERGSV